MTRLFSTKEVAQFLGINEKMVYTLISEKGLPASKITGKWIFPSHLVEQWVESNTINYPQAHNILPQYEGLMVLAGSNDILLDKVLNLFNARYSEHLAVFGNLGSVGGINALRRGLCHMATSHLLQENGNEYNFDFLQRQFERIPVVVNFCMRGSGDFTEKGKPVGDFRREGPWQSRGSNRQPVPFLPVPGCSLRSRASKSRGSQGKESKGTIAKLVATWMSGLPSWEGTRTPDRGSDRGSIPAWTRFPTHPPGTIRSSGDPGTVFSIRKSSTSWGCFMSRSSSRLPKN